MPNVLLSWMLFCLGCTLSQIIFGGENWKAELFTLIYWSGAIIFILLVMGKLKGWELYPYKSGISKKTYYETGHSLSVVKSREEIKTEISRLESIMPKRQWVIGKIEALKWVLEEK